MTSFIDLKETQRLGVYLGWDATEEAIETHGLQPTLLQRLTGNVPVPMLGESGSVTPDSIDLDLCCYAFDIEKNCIDQIRPGTGRDINDTESMYHSGDETTGYAGEFDEELFIEFSKLPRDVHDILLYIRINGDVEVEADTHVKFRLIDATHSTELLTKRLPFDGKGEKGCIAGRLTRNADGWHYRSVNVYMQHHPDDSETKFFAPYVT